MTKKNATTTYLYDFADDRNGDIQFRTRVTDPEEHWKDSYTNVRGLTTSTLDDHNQDDDNPNTQIWTSFKYNAINELMEVWDDHENKIISAYDWLGRRTGVIHPDAGESTFMYDLASNLTNKMTAKLAEKDSTISYEYDFERLSHIKYPFNTYNNVSYTYGEVGADYNRAGRIVEQNDATGKQIFWYDELGNITKNERTINIPDCEALEFTTQYTYDTWNRLSQMIYPDEEVLTYQYNTGGLLNRMDGFKRNTDYCYVKQLGYDKFEDRVYMRYGNETETQYTYEPERRRLDMMWVENSKHRRFIDYDYTYDKVSNITRFENRSTVEPESHLLGGNTNYTYTYDDMYRLTKADGYHKGSKGEDQYILNMAYNNLHSIESKDQLHERKINTADVFIKRKKTSYNLGYEYDANKQPHAAIKVGDNSYSYDANGNQSGWDNDKDDNFRRILWDEENRLAAINDNGAVFKYLYDAGGERILKNTGISQAVSINGDIHPQYDPATWGLHWNNGEAWLDHWHDNHHSSGHHDHAPDDHDHHHHGVGGHDHLGDDCLGSTSIYVNPYIVIRNRTVTKHFYMGTERVVTKMGDPWDELLQNDRGPLDELHDEQHGFGPAIETDVYYYHPDHLGNTGYVTQVFGEVSQHVEYFAFGETFLEEHNNTTDRTPYLFNAKELDEETGLYYYGARYYDPVVSTWLSVDPLADQAPGWTPYRFGFNNPIRYTDPDGQWEWDVAGNLVAQKGDQSYSLAKFLGTNQKNAMTILNRGGVTANDKGILNLKEGQSFAKNDLWVGFKSGSGAVVNNSKEATSHYFNENGAPADVGDASTVELLSSDVFQSKHTKITSKKVQATGNFAVDLTDETFHIGRTKVDYSVGGNVKSSSVTYTLFSGDGFWDPNFVAEKSLGKFFDRYKPDGKGPNLETPGGTPYDYKTRERTFFFKPVEEQ